MRAPAASSIGATRDFTVSAKELGITGVLLILGNPRSSIVTSSGSTKYRFGLIPDSTPTLTIFLVIS